MDPIEALRRSRVKQRPKFIRGAKVFTCDVIREPVLIRLRQQFSSQERKIVVECSQTECQYHGTNDPACPLHFGLFDPGPGETTKS